jgi:hypothetical protein
MGISGLPLGSPRTKWHLGAGPMARHKVYYKGKVVASPKSRPWWVLWICVYPWLIRAPKSSNYALTNLLFGLCKSVWVSEVLVNLPNPIMEFQHAPLPPKCCKPRGAPQLLLLSIFSPLDLQLNPSKSLQVRQKCIHNHFKFQFFNKIEPKYKLATAILFYHLLWCTHKLINIHNYESKGKIMEEGVGVHSLACNTSGVEGRARSLGWALGQVTSKLIIHTNLHKPNNKLISV